MNVLHDVTSTSLIYSTNRRNEVDMDIVVRDLDSGEETVVFDDGGYVVQTSVSHDESSVAVTALSLQPNGTVVSLAGPLGSGALTSPDEHANHHVVGWAADDDGVLVASDHDRDHHAVWHVDLDGTWRILVEDDEHDLGAAASRGRLVPAGQPPRRRPRRPRDPRGRRHATASTSTSDPSCRCRCAGRPTGPASC